MMKKKIKWAPGRGAYVQHFTAATVSRSPWGYVTGKSQLSPGVCTTSGT